MKFDSFVSPLVQIAAGIIIGFIITSYLWKNDSLAYQSAIKQCEAELPRNQHCKITAVVDTK